MMICNVQTTKATNGRRPMLVLSHRSVVWSAFCPKYLRQSGRDKESEFSDFDGL